MKARAYCAHPSIWDHWALRTDVQEKGYVVLLVRQQRYELMEEYETAFIVCNDVLNKEIQHQRPSLAYSKGVILRHDNARLRVARNTPHKKLQCWVD
ncbi:hypothetical protein TNCV_2994821 [Trichonephila clavipes]|nr:hypothetical protein TNCV_2994821 [Trichonephila clavipes]